jgi:hypothetical protein
MDTAVPDRSALPLLRAGAAAGSLYIAIRAAQVLAGSPLPRPVPRIGSLEEQAG